MITVYVSVGNSDDRLTQQQYSGFVSLVDKVLDARVSRIHGAWVSESAAAYQNACWCVDVPEDHVEFLRLDLSAVARQFRQDSIVWAEVKGTDFLR